MLGVIPKIDVVTVGAAWESLATLLGASLQADTTRVFIRPHATGIYMSNVPVAVDFTPLGTEALLLEGRPGDLANVSFAALGNTDMTVIQNGVLWFADAGIHK